MNRCRICALFRVCQMEWLISCIKTYMFSKQHKNNNLIIFYYRWMDVWDLLSQECRDEVVLIDADLLLETLENYLRKHRFCSECKSKVLRAYNILTGDIEGDGEKGYCANLYEGLKSCPKERHIHVLCDTDFIAHLIDRAEPELTGGRRERHARTIEIAQEEVLTCLGIHLWERLHRLWQKLRAEEQTWQMLFYLGVEALRKNFEVAIEDKQGISRLEQVVEEISEAERAKELKKEQKRMKKKKRKENKCKFANELAEKKGTITNGHNVESLGKENGFENENDRESCKSESKEEKPVHCSVETKVNGSLTCKENGSKENNIVESTTTESVINDSKNSRKSIENDCDSITDSLLYDSCDCGDDVKENPHRKNGFINASEEKPFTLYSKAKGPTNGYVTPPACRSCGQQLSPRDKYDRGPPSDRGKGAAVYSEICAKCAAMNSEGGKRRNRKKVSKSKEFHENFNPRPKTDSKNTTRHHPIKDIDTKTNEFNDAELKLLESMGWHRLDDDATSDSGQSSLLEDAVISEQEIKEFQARKKDMQSQREQLRERLRHQFQMMCIHHSANCPCIDRPANGIKLK